ncbi:endonuclease domain-containing protein [Streptomyces sp. NPDC102359]|uniref:endonuclease domain-containing protein n=1 Tax=Streptomyces sp. NPDC102359 TaxID=3366159 RepID=UPI003805410A
MAAARTRRTLRVRGTSRSGGGQSTMGKMNSCLECGTRYLVNSKGRAARYCGDACRNRAISIQTTGSMYGLTVEQVQELRRIGACMICASTDSGFGSGIFAIDHCHESGVVRGALCQPCNLMLGNAKDSVDVLLAAIKYLTKNHEIEPWNQGPSRVEVMRDQQEARLVARLQQANKELMGYERRVKELEATLAAVDDDVHVAARRRARDADAVDRFIAAHISPCASDCPPLPVSEIRKAWATWAGGAPCPVTSMADALYKLGGTQRRSSKGRYWVGLTVSPSEGSANTAKEDAWRSVQLGADEEGDTGLEVV